MLIIILTGDWITVSFCYIHDHWKASLVGHSDNNGSEDRGHMTVTYKHKYPLLLLLLSLHGLTKNSYWKNLNSRTPSFRFGTGHVYNNYFEDVNDGINTRQGAMLLVENNVFVNPKKPLYSTDGGYADASGNDFGGGENTALYADVSVPYSYNLGSTSTTKNYVIANVWVSFVGLIQLNANVGIGW
jgi:pectate lyase